MAKVAKKPKEVKEKSKYSDDSNVKIKKSSPLRKVVSKVTKKESSENVVSLLKKASPTKTAKYVKKSFSAKAVKKETVKDEVKEITKRFEVENKKQCKTFVPENDKNVEMKGDSSSLKTESKNSLKKEPTSKLKGGKVKKHEESSDHSDTKQKKKTAKSTSKTSIVSTSNENEKDMNNDVPKSKDQNKIKQEKDVASNMNKSGKVKLKKESPRTESGKAQNTKILNLSKKGKVSQEKDEETTGNEIPTDEKYSIKELNKPRKTRNKPKKSITDIYKSRHNIGKRVAAGRVCSYKETEISLVFPDDYWTVPSCKVDIPLSGSVSSNENSFSSSKSSKSDSSDVSEDEEVQFNFDAQKRRAENRHLDAKKKSSKVSHGKSLIKKLKAFSSSSSKDSEKNSSKLKTNKQECVPKSTSKSKKEKTSKYKKGKNKIKRKSKFEDILPRAPRIQRTACLNASAINSLMYDYSAPPKKLKVDHTSVKDVSVSVQSDVDTETTMDEDEVSDQSTSDYEEDKDDKKKNFKATKVKAKQKKRKQPEKKSKDHVKAKKVIAKNKKKAMKRKNQEMLEILMQPLPKRMASLNAQAIMTACKELDEMKIPPETKAPKESKKEKSKFNKPKEEDDQLESVLSQKLDDEKKMDTAETFENSQKSPLKSPAKSVKSPLKQGKTYGKRFDSNITTEELPNYTEIKVSDTGVGQTSEPSEHLYNKCTVQQPTSQTNSANLKDPYEFVDVVDDDNKMTASRPLMTSQALKVQVSSPEIIVDSPTNSPPKAIASYQQGFQPVRPSMPTPKPQYPPNVPFHMQQTPHPSDAHMQAPFPHGGFRPSFHHQLQSQSAGQQRQEVSVPSLTPSMPSQLAHSSTDSPFQQPTSQAYTASSSSQHMLTQQPPASGFQASNRGGYGPTPHPPVQLVPAYPPSSTGFSQQQQHQMPINPSPVPSSTKLPVQSGNLGTPSPATHTPGLPAQHQREASTSSGRSSVSSLTDQSTPPSGQGYNHQAHRSTPLGNTVTYPYPHGRTNTHVTSHPVTGTNVTHGHHHPSYMQHATGLSGMEGYPGAGYPLMAYHPRHYGPHAAMFGGYPTSQQNTTTLQGQGLSSTGGSSSSTGMPHSQAQGTGPKNIYMGYGYYQPAGPLLQTGTHPFHMLQQQHMKAGLPVFTPAMAHSKSPFVPQEMMLFPGKPAFQDPTDKKSPSKRVSTKSVSASVVEKSPAKPKVDALDLSMENKTQVPPIPKTVANLQKSEIASKKGIFASDSSSGEEQASPEKQTKDILDLDSKKVKVHRGAVGETDRNSPLKIPKGSKKSKTDNVTGYPVQTYRFEAHPRITRVSEGVPNFMNATTIEGGFQSMAIMTHSQNTMKTTVHSKHAETKTVAANMAIPFYSKPLSVQTSAAEGSGVENRMFLGRDTITNRKTTDIIQERVSNAESKKNPSQNANSGPIQHRKGFVDNQNEQNQKRDLVNPVISLPGNQMMMKPVMPVLPLPSGIHSSSSVNQAQRAVVPPMTMGIPFNIQSPRGKSPESIDKAVSSVVNPAAIKSKCEKSKGSEKCSKGVVHSYVSGTADISMIGEKAMDRGIKSNQEAILKSPVKTVDHLSNTNNSARGASDGKKTPKKDSVKGETKTPKKDHGKSKDSPKSALKPDSLKIKLESGQKASTSKTKPESPRQKSKVPDGSKHKAESPKSKITDSPKQQRYLLESPKHKSDTSKFKPESPKQTKPDSRIAKPDSPRYKSESRSKLELGPRFRFESPKKREENLAGKPSGNSSTKKERRRSIEEKRFSPGNIGKRKIQSAPPVIHSGWKWEGQPELKPIACPGEAPVLRKSYQAVRHNDGDLVSVRDCVLVKSGPRKKDIPFVAKVAAFWELAPYGEMMMSVLWYYRPEQTEMERLPRRERCEIYASRHRDIIPVACIDDKAYVLTFNEYCRFKSEQRRVAENGQDRPAIIPKPSDNASPLPPLNAPAETVFLCRRVYDVKLKRMLKNPQASYICSSPNSSKSHTPTPSSKSPSPKSASPVVPRLQLHQMQNSAEHNMEIVQAITTLAQLTSNLNAASIDLSLKFGLPICSSVDMNTGSHHDIVSSSHHVDVDICHPISSAVMMRNQNRRPKQHVLHTLPGEVTSSKSRALLPVKLDLSCEDEKPNILPQYRAFAAISNAAAADLEQFDAKSSLSVPPIKEAKSPSNASDVEDKLVIDESESISENIFKVADKVKSENAVESEVKVPESIAEQKPVVTRSFVSTTNTLMSSTKIDGSQNVTTSLVPLQSAKTNETEIDREKLLQQAVKELTGTNVMQVESSGTKHSRNDDSIMDIDDDDVSGELVMDLDCGSDSDSEVEVDRSGIYPKTLSSTLITATPIKVVQSDIKEPMPLSPCKVGSSSDVNDVMSPINSKPEECSIEKEVFTSPDVVNDTKIEQCVKEVDNETVPADSSKIEPCENSVEVGDTSNNSVVKETGQSSLIARIESQNESMESIEEKEKVLEKITYKDEGIILKDIEKLSENNENKDEGVECKEIQEIDKKKEGNVDELPCSQMQVDASLEVACNLVHGRNVTTKSTNNTDLGATCSLEKDKNESTAEPVHNLTEDVKKISKNEKRESTTEAIKVEDPVNTTASPSKQESHISSCIVDSLCEGSVSSKLPDDLEQKDDNSMLTIGSDNNSINKSITSVTKSLVIDVPSERMQLESNESSDTVSKETSCKDVTNPVKVISDKSTDIENSNSDFTAATPSLLILEQMSEEVTKEFNTGKTEMKSMDSCAKIKVTTGNGESLNTSRDVKHDSSNTKQVLSNQVVSDDQKDIATGSFDKASEGSSKGNTVATLSEEVKTKFPKDSFIEENSNDTSLGSDATTSESSTEVPGDGTNMDEIIGTEISFGSPSGDDNNIPLEIFSNEASPNLRPTELSLTKIDSVQVDNVSTTLPNLAAIQDNASKSDSASCRVSSSQKLNLDKDETSEKVTSQISHSQSFAKDEKDNLTDSTVSSSVVNTQKESLTKVPNEDNKSDPSIVVTSKASISSTSTISVSPVASRMIPSGLKSPNASGSGISRIEQIVSQIKMAGLGSGAAATTCSSSISDSTFLNKSDDSSCAISTVSSLDSKDKPSTIESSDNSENKDIEHTIDESQKPKNS